MDKAVEHRTRYQAVIPSSYQLLAQVISYIFHPVFMLTYAYVLLALFNPFQFGEATTVKVFALGDQGKGIWFVNWVFLSALVPVIAILMMRMLGMVSAISLPTQDERKIPYILTGMFYMSLVASNSYNTSLPLELKTFALGATIALFLAFFINLFSKISMHAVGAGGFLAMIFIIVLRSYPGAEYLLIFAFLVCGLVGTSRMLLGVHNTADIYGGFFVGFFPQFIALDYIF